MFAALMTRMLDESFRAGRELPADGLKPACLAHILHWPSSWLDPFRPINQTTTLTMTSLLDQTALSDLAERLVSAAKRAGADAADAIAVRGASLSVEVRDGAVEESQRSEGDDLGLRVLVGKKQAVVSSNDLDSSRFDELAERAVAMARAAPEDKFAGLADPSLLAHDFPALDLLDPDMPDVAVLERRAKEAEA